MGEAGPDKSTTALRGEAHTPLGAILRLAVQTGSTKAIVVRLRNGDAVDARDGQGRTPLMLAAARGHLDACKTLLAHKADASAVDFHGATSLELARNAGHWAIVDLLSSHIGTGLAPGSPPDHDSSHDDAPSIDIVRSTETDDGWEPESAVDDPAHDDSCVTAAIKLNDAIRAHSIVDRDEDWEDVDADLPLPLSHSGRVVLDEATRALLRKIFAGAVETGWTNPDQLLELMCGSQGPASDIEKELLRKSLLCLTDHGVLADSDAWRHASLEDVPVHANNNEREHVLDEMLAAVENSLSPRHEPLWSFARDLNQIGPLLDHDGEIRLGSSLKQGIRRAARALCGDRLAAQVLLSELDERATEPQSGSEMASEDDIGSDADALDCAPSADVEIVDALGATGSLEQPTYARTNSSSQSPAETVTLLRLAIEQLFTATNPGDQDKVELLLQDSIAATGLGVVQLFQIRERLPVSRISRSTWSEFQGGLEEAKHARDRLVQCNLRLVWSIARKYTFSSIPLVDLIQDGCIGLIRAVDKYDHTRGFRFSTYATWWIRQSVSRSVADCSRTIRVPVHMFEKLHRVERATETLRPRLGREPHIKELSAESGLTESEVQKALRVPREPCSTDDPEIADWPERLDPSFSEVVSPEDRLSLTQLRDWVAGMVDSLKPKEALVLRMRYGIGTEHEHTLEEVGRALDLTRERIRQVEQKAIKQLRQRLEKSGVSALPSGKRSDNTMDPDEGEQDPTPVSQPRRNVVKTPEVTSELPVREVASPSTTGSRPGREIAHALRLLASSQMQRSLASSLDVPSFQREFAHRWFQAYDAVDPEGNFSAVQHGAFQLVSGQLRNALRNLGFGRIEIEDLQCDPAWKDVVSAASMALKHLPIE